MSSTYSLSPPPNPHKRPRLSLSPTRHHSSYPSYPSHQPSLTNLASDRLASRNKLQSTWEDIIQKYSAINEDEADEIDLETGEVVVDHGHLKSLHDSSLWDPLDSEADDEDTPSEQADNEILRYYPHQPTPEPEEQDSTLPSEEEIIRQFGEEYGRDILQYLQQRNSSTNPHNRGKSQLWHGPKDEDTIFARARELWKQYRMRPSPLKHARFDKDSFERAVFGAAAPRFSKSAFEQAVFGHVQQQWIDEEKTGENEEEKSMEEFDKLVFGQGSFDEIVFGRKEVKEEYDEEEERRINLGGTLTTYAVDEDDDDDVVFITEKEFRQRRMESSVVERPGKVLDSAVEEQHVKVLETPKRMSTPIPKPTPIVISSKKRPRSTTRDKGRMNFISGLIVNASDEEDDFFSSITSPSPSVRLKKDIRRSVSKTPVVTTKRERSLSRSSVVTATRERSLSTSSSVRGKLASQTINDDAEEMKEIEEDTKSTTSKGTSELTPKNFDMDTKGNCGDVGYRCTKRFCFKCI